ncbi:hypothetical protein PENANT_c007G07015 [Penicillium antarcticum]|uniref:Cytochrome b5 heme-binding domain-containing protein n=1 Tax=Penicillium antarcticum TaxID=416450 RepID=A0A1V6QBA8_9EURO|nr:hypothetical protein PENANT_c007G07015 [Penicillium antarcticum]
MILKTHGEESLKVPHQYTWEYELKWYFQNVNWFYVMWFVGTPIPMAFAALYVPVQWKTALLAVTYGVGAAFGITVDTDQDPYNARRGLLFSHIGWMLGYNPENWGPVDTSDLKKDPVVVWQQRYYVLIAVTACLLLPTAVAYYGWNDWQGGLLYGGLIRVSCVSHSTFLVNSVSHATWAGKQPYTTKSTARNVPLLAILTLGEANHNYHHAFPSDYRNGIEWYEPDMSKWLIWALGKLGLASDLKFARPVEIELSRLRHENSRQHAQSPGYVNKTPQLPRIDWVKYISLANSGRCLVYIGGFVHDATEFMQDHPGGCHLVQQAIGTDATDAFYSGFHPHSPHAEAVLASLRVFRIDEVDDIQCSS